jgi:hypothetical protein
MFNVCIYVFCIEKIVAHYRLSIYGSAALCSDLAAFQFLQLLHSR